MSSSEEVQCVLILDLASDNPISERVVAPHLPPSARRRAYHVTAFGAPPAPRGSASSRRGWRDWTAAVDRMLKQAREDLGADRDIAHYYLAGRAALPIFAYLGLHLDKRARVTVVNQRHDGAWDIVPFLHPPDVQPSTSGGERFFDMVDGLRRDYPNKADGRVAVFVSTQRDLEEKAIRDFAKSLDTPLAGIVTLRARPQGETAHDALRLLGAGDGPRAASELVAHFTAIRDCYAHHSGLIVYIAGPVTLGAMVGRAINPHVHSPVWLPNFQAPRYEPAVEVPWPLVSGQKPKILILVANAPDAEGDRLGSDFELRDMVRAFEQKMKANGCNLRFCFAGRVRDLVAELRDPPHLFHFIGHGAPSGLYFIADDGSELFVHGDELHRILTSSKVEDMHLAVLNACNSDELAETLTAVVDCAIGTTIDVLDESAIRFARCFYDDLVHGWSVADAFKRATAESTAGTSDERQIFEIHARDGIDLEQLVFFSPADRGD